MKELSERSILLGLGRFAASLAATALWCHFVFIASLTEPVTVSSLLLFLIATAWVVPPIRQRVAALPVLRRSWVRRLIFLLLIVAANLRLVGGEVAEVHLGRRAFMGATLITGHLDRAPIRNGVILVDEAGLIVDVGSASSLSIPSDYEIVDLSGKYLLPGLINAHGHLMLSGRVPGEPLEMSRFAMPEWLMNSISWLMTTYPGGKLVLWRMQKNARIALQGGVTTLRGLGDPNFVDVEMRKRVESGRSIGPRLLVAGPLLCVTGGHAHQIGQVFDGPDEARRAVRNALRHEVDVIKIANTGGVSDSRRIGEAGELQMTYEEISAVTDEAHRKNVLVAAHAESAEGVIEALRAGVDSIEHGAELDAESIALLKNNPRSLRGYTTYHPTLSVVADDIEMTDAVRDDPVVFVMVTNARLIREAMLSGFKTAAANGVKLGVGTDAGIVHHGSVWKEMAYFVEFGGLSNQQALHIGTLGTAESIGVDAITGSLDKGKYADFLVVDGNPIADLSALATPEMVVASGAIVDLP